MTINVKPQGAFVDRTYVGWAQLEFQLGGKTLIAFTSIEGGDSVEDELVYGAGIAPIGRARGDYKPDNVKIKMYLESVQEMIQQLTAGGTPLYRHKPIDATLTFAPEASEQDPSPTPIKRVYKGLTLMKLPENISRGDKKMEVDVEFLCMGVWRDGIKPVPVGKK